MADRDMPGANSTDELFFTIGGTRHLGRIDAACGEDVLRGTSIS